MDNNDTWKKGSTPPLLVNLLDKLVSIKDLLEKERDELMKQAEEENLKDKDGDVGVE